MRACILALVLGCGGEAAVVADAGVRDAPMRDAPATWDAPVRDGSSCDPAAVSEAGPGTGLCDIVDGGCPDGWYANIAYPVDVQRRCAQRDRAFVIGCTQNPGGPTVAECYLRIDCGEVAWSPEWVCVDSAWRYCQFLNNPLGDLVNIDFCR